MNRSNYSNNSPGSSNCILVPDTHFVDFIYGIGVDDNPCKFSKLGSSRQTSTLYVKNQEASIKNKIKLRACS